MDVTAKFGNSTSQRKDERRKQIIPLESRYISPQKAVHWVLAPFTQILTRIQHEMMITKETNRNEMHENLLNTILAKKPTLVNKNLIGYLTETSVPSFIQETAYILKDFTKSSGVVLYLVDRNAKEIYQFPNKVLSPRDRVTFKIEPGKTVAAYVAYSKQIVYTRDLLSNPEFPMGLGWKDSTRKAALVVPVLTPDNKVAIVIELTKDTDKGIYKLEDALATLGISSWIGAVVHHQQKIAMAERDQQIFNYLYEIIKRSVLLSIPLERIISEIMNFSKQSIGADKSRFVLLEQNKHDTFMVTYNECTESKLHKIDSKVLFSNDNNTVAAKVLRTGRVMNMKEREMVNSETVTTSIIAAPVITNEPIGVLILISKKEHGSPFTVDDEQMLLMFAEYASFAAAQWYAVEQAQNEDTKGLILDETIQLQFRPCKYELNYMTKSGIDSEDLLSFKWELRNEEEAPQISVILLKHFLKDLILREKSFHEFVIAVKKNCTPFLKLDFLRAFMALHTLAVILNKNDNFFKPSECEVLSLVAFCHRITGNGYNEFHLLKLLLHTYTTMKDFSSEDFNEIMTEISLLMQFGRSSHSQFCKIELYHILKKGNVDWKNVYHRYLLKIGILTVSGVSYRFKTSGGKMFIGNYYENAVEHLKVNRHYLVKFDSEGNKYDFIAQNEADYLGIICIPWISILNSIFPNTKELFLNACRALEHWGTLKDLRSDTLWRPA